MIDCCRFYFYMQPWPWTKQITWPVLPLHIQMHITVMISLQRATELSKVILTPTFRTEWLASQHTITMQLASLLPSSVPAMHIHPTYTRILASTHTAWENESSTSIRSVDKRDGNGRSSPRSWYYQPETQQHQSPLQHHYHQHPRSRHRPDQGVFKPQSRCAVVTSGILCRPHHSNRRPPHL
jgi:hypothetical protein